MRDVDGNPKNMIPASYRMNLSDSIDPIWAIKVVQLRKPWEAIFIAEGGLKVPYDRLILAVGSDPIRLPLPGAELQGVVTFRDLDDVNAMTTAADSGSDSHSSASTSRATSLRAAHPARSSPTTPPNSAPNGSASTPSASSANSKAETASWPATIDRTGLPLPVGE